MTQLGLTFPHLTGFEYPPRRNLRLGSATKGEVRFLAVEVGIPGALARQRLEGRGGFRYGSRWVLRPSTRWSKRGDRAVRFRCVGLRRAAYLLP